MLTLLPAPPSLDCSRVISPCAHPDRPIDALSPAGKTPRQGKGIRRPLHNLGVVAARGSTLFTVTVLAPEEAWGGGRGATFQQMARSFRLT